MPMIEAALAQDRPAPPAPQRVALALGLVGALGDELLSVLLASPDYRAVHVGVRHPIGSATERFRPWIVRSDTVAADDAFIALTGPETFVPKASPLHAFGAADTLDAARIARAAGARRLVLVSPLAALLQMSAGTQAIANEAEMALVQMGFTSLVIVRPTAADDPRPAGHWIQGLVRTMGRTLADLMLPAYARALSARSAAHAILEVARDARPGVTVLGARELLAIVEAKFPALAPKRRRIR